MFMELHDEDVLTILRALADPRRYEILQRLSERKEALACQSVRDCIPVSAATLSHHMRELELAGLVHVERRQKTANYTLRRDVLKAFLARLRSDLV